MVRKKSIEEIVKTLREKSVEEVDAIIGLRKEYRRCAEILEEARSLEEKGRYNDAIKLAKTIVSCQGVGDRAFILLGDIHIKMGLREAAIDYYKKADESAGHIFIAGTWYDRAGYVTFKDKNFEESIYWYKKKIRYFVNFDSIKDIEKSYMHHHPPPIAIEEEKKRFTLDLCRSGIALACKQLGKIYLKIGEPEKALPFLKKAKQMYGNDTGLKLYLKKAKQYSDGKEKPDKILKLIPEKLRPTQSSTEEMLKHATSYAEAVMGKRYWTDYKGWKESTWGKFNWTPAFDRSYSYYKEEIELLDELWTIKCNEVLRRTLKKWRWETHKHILNEIVNALSSNELKKWKNIFQHHGYKWENINDRENIVSYAMMKAKELFSDLRLSYKSPQIRRCKKCGKTFFEGNIPSSFAIHFNFPAEPLEYCPKCLGSAFLAAYKRKKSREEMKRDLRKLVEVLGFIPPQSFMSIGNYSTLLKKLSRKKLIEIVPAMVEILPHEIYIKEFGSWFKALVDSGVLSDDAKREVYGTKCLAKDGHECFSIAEKIIDDWLFDNRIAHEKEPFYPKDKELNPNGEMRADWKVDNSFIEFFGLKGLEKYEERIKQKRKLVKKRNMRLIEIYPDDLYNLDNKLGTLRETEHIT